MGSCRETEVCSQHPIRRFTANCNSNSRGSDAVYTVQEVGKYKTWIKHKFKMHLSERTVKTRHLSLPWKPFPLLQDDSPWSLSLCPHWRGCSQSLRLPAECISHMPLSAEAQSSTFRTDRSVWRQWTRPEHLHYISFQSTPLLLSKSGVGRRLKE